jgi:hypothetical protein
MPARVLSFTTNRGFIKCVATSLKRAAHDVATYLDPMHALDALATPQRVEVLITRTQFPLGKPNGIALGLMVPHKRPGLGVLFCACLHSRSPGQVAAA